MKTLLGFYQAGRDEKDFDEGIQKGLERILAAPELFVPRRRRSGERSAGSAYRLSDLDLASRLSFFLWSSIPDDELRNLAVRGRLRDPKVLEQQVQRMLHDPRSRALVDGFANRWLGLSKLAGIVPDTDLYREFDENLRDAMAKETQTFVASQLQEDRGVMELLTADYTYVNERLAKHYGIPEYLWKSLPAREIHRRRARRAARAGEHTGGDVLPESHLRRAPRPVLANESAGRASAASAAGCAGAQGSGRGRPASRAA